MVELPDLAVWIRHLLRQIPMGKVMTYGQVARLMGNITAARYIGEYARRHDHTNECPCHRLVRQTGELGLYVSGETREKETRLRAEGVIFKGDHVDLKQSGWQPDGDLFNSPLTELHEYQESICRAVKTSPLTGPIKLIAGVDLAYPKKGIGQAACVILNARTLKVEHELIQRSSISFPYISGYLAFRELPLLLSIWEELVRQNIEPDLIFVDGNGQLHPRKAGIASCLGVEINKPTIGIGKSLLCGSVPKGDETERPVLFQNETIGMAITSRRSQKPYYVSVGHRLTLAEAVDWTHRAGKQKKHRLPEPIFLADRLSRQ
ncbi:Endonuclease V [Polystyrenella longa]|uniref:Endonuclease V n=1 Tax=Polystyrenella longa TaxID=2528007 RepID=A0A518CGQ3_9PLAN|nr:endonuclease V [Polystyrenella longa]QDU78354.1 Endonuclease V [Polystyrenella longa]